MLRTNREGFTLVELLIVIVVIAILAAITIVAYNGVQDRAHDSAAHTTATEVIKKALLFQTEYAVYPASLAILNGQGTGTSGASMKIDQSDSAYLPSGDYTAATSSDLDQTTPSKPSEDNTVLYTACASNAGAKVTYWDYSAGSPTTLTSGICD